MSLTVNASKTGLYQAISNFQTGTGHGFFADIRVIPTKHGPEPSSELGILLASALVGSCRLSST